MGISDVPWKANHTCNTIPSFGSVTESRKLKPSRHAGPPAGTCRHAAVQNDLHRNVRDADAKLLREDDGLHRVHMRKSEGRRLIRLREPSAVICTRMSRIELQAMERGRWSRSTHGTVRPSALGVLGAHALPHWVWPLRMGSWHWQVQNRWAHTACMVAPSLTASASCQRKYHA
jgi:hypothetical protein